MEKLIEVALRADQKVVDMPFGFIFMALFGASLGVLFTPVIVDRPYLPCLTISAAFTSLVIGRCQNMCFFIAKMDSENLVPETERDFVIKGYLQATKDLGNYATLALIVGAGLAIFG